MLRTPNGDVILDFGGGADGRGAYLCNSVNCLVKAKKARRIERALKCQVPAEVFARLEE